MTILLRIALLPALALLQAAGAWVHDNNVQFNGADQMSFDETGYSITDGQPFESVTVTSNSNIDVRAGRKHTSKVTADFMDGMAPENILGLKMILPFHIPKELNFAVFGNMNLTFGNEPCTLKDFRFAQGHHDIENNWFAGSRDCLGQTTVGELVCTCSDSPLIHRKTVHFTPGDSDHDFNIRMETSSSTSSSSSFSFAHSSSMSTSVYASIRSFFV